MNTYLWMAKEFFEKNKLSIKKTFNQEKNDYIEYTKLLSDLDNMTRNQIARLAVNIIEEIMNKRVSSSTVADFDLSVERDIKRKIKLDFLADKLPDINKNQNKINFLRRIIFKEPSPTTYNIIDDKVYNKWLELLKEKHKSALKAASQKILPKEKEDWIKNEYDINRKNFSTDHAWAKSTAKKFQEEFGSKTSPVSIKRYGKGYLY